MEIAHDDAWSTEMFDGFIIRRTARHGLRMSVAVTYAMSISLVIWGALTLTMLR